jgi:hypothetical protein
MKRSLAAAVALVLWAATAYAKLEIQDIKPVYGILGPERKNLDLMPFEDVIFRFRITGMKLDDAGKTDLTVNMVLTNASGKKEFEQILPGKEVLYLGGHSTVGHVRLTVGPDIREGEYTLEVTATDNLAKQSASFQRKLATKKFGLTIVSPQFFFDPKGLVPAPPGGYVGQKLYFAMKCIGFAKDQERAEIETNVQILDENGKETMPQPIRDKVQARADKTVKAIAFGGDILLNRLGKFTLRVKVTDKTSGKSAYFETPLRVEEP